MTDGTIPCDVPPPGWRCTREHGHDGPCAAVPQTPTIVQPVFIDPVAFLRNLADKIEGGEFGDVRTVATVVHSDTDFAVLCGGRDGSLPHTVTAFQAGVMHVLKDIAL